MLTTRFRDRAEAGRMLAARLKAYAHRPGVVVLALPRGGVPVGYEIAKALHVPLDVFIVRKLGVPGHEELAMGAIASGGVRVLNEEVVAALRLRDEVIDLVAEAERRELERRERLYRGDRPPLNMRGRTVILVDDGIATGATIRAAVIALYQQQPLRLIVAVPVAAADTCEALRAEVDELVCVMTPEPFYAISIWYEDFSPTTDEEVSAWLKRSAREQPTPLPSWEE
ncbi:MAG: phosphoribosyltransferase [Abditibacteriales bacterium]|nr:phosphoribosyltransferase [Abditibacteriales bacterium]MDW8365713.1 phosphoribosyltransferase [Abditibacteriales bacterium]